METQGNITRIMTMSPDKSIDSLSLGLLKQDNWAYFGAKKLVETLGLPLFVETRAENLHDADVLIVPRVNKEDEDVLLRLVSAGRTLITEGGITGTEFERALDVLEQSSTVQDGVIVLHCQEGNVSLPPLVEYLHKANDTSNGSEWYYEVDDSRYLFNVERSIGKGKVILLSSLFSLVSRTYSWVSGTICNQDLLSQPYLDLLSDIFLEVIAKETNRKNKALVRLWYFPDFKQEAAALVTFDIDDKYSYRPTVKKSPYERGKKWAFYLGYLPLSRFVSALKRVAEQRLSTRSKEAAGVGFFIRLWKGLNRLFTPNFLELVEKAGGKAVLFLRPPGIQEMESRDKTGYRLESYEIRKEDVQGVSAIHEVALHFGRSLITISDARAEDTKSYWTNRIPEQLTNLEKAAGTKIYGSRGHFSLFYPETIEQVETAGCRWDSTYYGQQRWVSPDGKMVEFGYNGFSPSWTASIVGTSLPFYPVIARPGSALRESAVLELPTTLYEPRNIGGAVLASIGQVLQYHGVINIQYHPFDAANYAELRKILLYLKDESIWKTTGKELSAWWQQRRETKIGDTRLRMNNEELFIESNLDTSLDTLSLIINIPEGMDISGVRKIASSSLKVRDYEIDTASSVVRLNLQTKP